MVGELKAFARCRPNFAPHARCSCSTSPTATVSETKALETACARNRSLGALHLLEQVRSHHARRTITTCSAFCLNTSRAAPACRGQLKPCPCRRCRAICHAPAVAGVLDRRCGNHRNRRCVFAASQLPGLGWRVGIHIAAPGLGIVPGSPLDVHGTRTPVHRIHAGQQDHHAARSGGRELHAGRRPRLSVAFALPHGDATTSKSAAHESLRRDWCLSSPTCAITIIEPLFNEADAGWRPRPNLLFADELKTLWQLANACEGRRGKPSAMARQQRLQLRHRRRLWPPRDAVPRRDQRAPARQPARQAGRRTDDCRQQHLGRSARCQGRGRPSTARRPAARCA